MKRRSIPSYGAIAECIVFNFEIVPMSKPIGHFTSYTLNDGSLLESLQEQYGSTFERMTKREKLFLISAIAIQLCDQAPGRCREEIYVVGHQANSSLPVADREGLIEALINQVRYGQSLPVERGGLPMQQ
ncbi:MULTISPECIES: hypothetical protein [unclassified Nostoc]|uniref:hypothetical protein n=1 Tax=unclassified Nostoc TaxID=2593658 RepID=UPI002AD21116|nr:hypothetical protein [Nostoc sp. DedQUE03]MDZ7975769.1 hypothetical protein [Nostoc sp. DedQUE03]MDZ8048302.1 hypothetical protein [Nostoc sp. DedQUE02]